MLFHGKAFSDRKTKLMKSILHYLLAIALVGTFVSNCGLLNPTTNPDKDLLLLIEHVSQHHIMESADIKYIADKISHNVPHELNMAHDAQYRYVLHQLREGGDSPEKSPALYKHLKTLRDKGEAAHPVVAAAWTNLQREEAPAGGEAPLGGGAAGGLSDINLLSSLYSEDQITYTADGISSINGGTQSTAMSFNYRTVNNPPFHSSPVYKAFGPTTENWTQASSGTVPTNQRDQNVVASILIMPSGGAPITMSSEDALSASDQCVTAPNYQNTQNANTAPCPSLSSPTCINKGAVSTPIVSCYGRNNSQTGYCGNCNYGYPAPGHPDMLALMVAGTIDFPYPIAPNATGQPVGALNMFLQQTGGGCILESQFQNVALPVNFTINPNNDKQLIYCFKGGDFTSTSCFKQLVHSNVDFNMTVYVQLTVPGTGSNYAQAKVSSTMCKSINEAWCANVPEICVAQGCLAKGTMIALADGGEKAVEDFIGGESVKSTDQNRTVGATSSGQEWLPMYRIKTKNNKSVFISNKHAVPTNTGMKLAKDLAVGDVLTTDEGQSKIAAIEKEMYSGTVHNFSVGDESDVTKGLANMYANGILVGDLASQQFYTQSKLMKIYSIEELKKEVHEDWHTDLENHLKNQ